MRERASVWVVAVGVSCLCASAFLVARQSTGNPEAAKTKNPVAVTPESIAAGKKLYDEHCAGCHAPEGQGGLMLSITEDRGLPPPPTLNDAEWDHGSTDGEIFAVLQNGVGPEYVMGPWKGRVPDEGLWHVVNYLKSLAPRK